MVKGAKEWQQQSSQSNRSPAKHQLSSLSSGWHLISELQEEGSCSIEAASNEEGSLYNKGQGGNTSVTSF